MPYYMNLSQDDLNTSAYDTCTQNKAYVLQNPLVLHNYFEYILVEVAELLVLVNDLNYMFYA